MQAGRGSPGQLSETGFVHRKLEEEGSGGVGRGEVGRRLWPAGVGKGILPLVGSRLPPTPQRISTCTSLH